MAPLPAPPVNDADRFEGAQAAKATVVPRARPPSTRDRLLRLTPLSPNMPGFDTEKLTTK